MLLLCVCYTLQTLTHTRVLSVWLHLHVCVVCVVVLWCVVCVRGVLK